MGELIFILFSAVVQFTLFMWVFGWAMQSLLGISIGGLGSPIHFIARVMRRAGRASMTVIGGVSGWALGWFRRW